VINNEINAFVTHYMCPRIDQLKSKPVFVYNTWYPFRTFVNDKLIREVATAAAECGIQEFIIDDGWQVNIGGKTSDLAWGGNYGDWKVDEKKFPGGLKPTFDYIRSLGMKPGLWISIGSATKDAQVFKEHPEWFVKNRDNQLGNLHTIDENSDFYTSCFGTDWLNYIKNVILGLVKDYGLAYAKLDLSVVTSAYVNDNSISGCYATDHPYHHDRKESFLIIYERVLRLFDELHAAAPDLFIDCTFETAGKLQLMDYAIAQHAEGNWLSNFEEPSPVGPLRVRQMAWWRSPALPASSLVIGNQPMDDPDFEFMVKSLIGSLPIVLGDPRKLTPEKRAMIKKWSEWMQQMQEKYNYMSYRKDLPGFSEPKEGTWDGWMRINFTDKSGGVFGVFRQGALEDTRIVFLQDLEPDKNYVIRMAPYGKEIVRSTGKKLMNEGFRVQISKLFDGNIYEVGL
jgi:alpha-galactosidase